jgi:hypothetical protein
MIEQLYFLSVVLNAAAGCILFTDDKRPSPDPDEGFKFEVGNLSFRLCLGIALGVMGILSILASSDVPVVGDLLPALVCLACGFALVLDFYKAKTSLPTDSAQRLTGAFDTYRKPLGVAALAVALLHFLLPRIIFI